MKRLMLLVALLLPVSFSFGANEDWTGDYSYWAYYGKTYGGSPIAREYTIRIRTGQPECEIEISGFQIFEEIVCRTKAEVNSLTLLFQSYKSGEVKNAYGVQIYRVEQPLLRFERTTRNGKPVLITHWSGIMGADGKKPRDGEMFKLVHKQ